MRRPYHLHTLLVSPTFGVGPDRFAIRNGMASTVVSYGESERSLLRDQHLVGVWGNTIS